MFLWPLNHGSSILGTAYQLPGQTPSQLEMEASTAFHQSQWEWKNWTPEIASISSVWELHTEFKRSRFSTGKMTQSTQETIKRTAKAFLDQAMNTSTNLDAAPGHMTVLITTMGHVWRQMKSEELKFRSRSQLPMKSSSAAQGLTLWSWKLSLHNPPPDIRKSQYSPSNPVQLPHSRQGSSPKLGPVLF